MELNTEARTETAPLGGPPSVEIARPDDWHVHLRDDEMLAAVAPITAATFRYALVMPNLVPPIATAAAAADYRQRILSVVGRPPDGREPFVPIMTAYLSPELDVDDLRRGAEAGIWRAVKYYPAGATTNSEHGGSSLPACGAVLDALCEMGLPLLVHAESTDPTIDIFDRERAFLDAELAPVTDAWPELAVTVEHVSTRAGVEFVTDHPQVRGSITPHHLRCDRSDLVANGLRPDLYCKPIINSADDRAALVAAATSGSPDWFLGTDSAPHPTAHKYTDRAKPGIFNAPFALPVVAEVFHRAGALSHLEAFVSLNGCAHYGYPPSGEKLRLTRVAEDCGSTGEPIPDSVVTADGQQVIIFGVDEARCWRVEWL
ncbi:MAG: dihydroorotase [Acidimicrobiia bacterium]|nr:dihydroorotase [Acidimicrobiia bacterium]